MNTALELARKIAAQSGVSVRTTVRTLRNRQEQDLESALWREGILLLFLHPPFCSPYMRQSIRFIRVFLDLGKCLRNREMPLILCIDCPFFVYFVIVLPHIVLNAPLPLPSPLSTPALFPSPSSLSVRLFSVHSCLIYITADAQAHCYAAEDILEGISAVREKRPPDYMKSK